MTQEVLKLALDYLESRGLAWNVQIALREALRENAMREVQRLGQEIEQEPVAWMKPHEKCDRACMYLCTKGFTQFPECVLLQRKPMTEEFIMDSTRELSMDVRWPSSFIDVWRLCEATHGVKK